jgi:hypothetical protein
MAACSTTKAAEPTYEAIYLVQGNGQLSQEDLQAHPEVMVTSSFDDFKKLAKNKTALWIDVNAAGLVDRNWLTEKLQRFYPIVLVGNSDTLCSFRDTLGGFGIIEGPDADCSSPASGFSVWMLEQDESFHKSAFMRGYEQVPSVRDILAKTNPLLSKQ